MIRALRAFLAFHQYGTIVAAAKSVHQSAAAVSVQLKLLEERLGVSLFVRSKRSLSFTAAGHSLIPLAEKMMSIYEDMQSLSETNKVTGKLSLGVINSALTGVFPSILKKLNRREPQLEIRIETGISPALLAEVDAGILDAAVITQPPKNIVLNLLIHHLYTEPIVLLMPKNMPYRYLSHTLKTQSYIAFDRTTWVGQKIEKFLSTKKISVVPVMELNSQDAVIAAVRHELGVSILPLSYDFNRITGLGLKYVALPELSRDVVLVERREHPQIKLTAHLIDLFSSLKTVK